MVVFLHPILGFAGESITLSCWNLTDYQVHGIRMDKTPRVSSQIKLWSWEPQILVILGDHGPRQMWLIARQRCATENGMASSTQEVKLGCFKNIPNSQKQKQLPNTQWVKYVYCPALLSLEVGRAMRNHSTNTLWQNAFPKAFAIITVANLPEARAKAFSQELLSASLFTSST